MNGIWKFFKNQTFAKRLTADEGDTPLFSKEINGEKVYFKDENQNPNGSFKDRSLAYQLTHYINQGRDNFVISSSGNAAISAAFYAKMAGVRLSIHVSNNINPAKLQKLKVFESEKIALHISDNPKSGAIKESNGGAINLRGSVDDHAKPGFATIAYELCEQLPQIDAIFIPCSSATSLVAIADGFAERGKAVAIYACQTARICPIAKEFDKSYVPNESSLADAISDRVAHRKSQAVNVIRASSGQAFAITDDELHAVKKIMPDYSYNSLLSLAGYFRAIQNGARFKAPVMLLSGL